MAENSGENIVLKKNPYNYGTAIRNLIKQGIPEEGARNITAQNIKEIRKNPTTRAILSESREKLKEAQHQALIDPLTGLFNKRHLGYLAENPTGVGELQREFDEAVRAHHDLAAVMLDIDNFREFNTVYGHPEGDRVLKAVAEVIKRVARDTDIPFRYGGEEFLLLLPETNSKGARILTERLTKEVAAVTALKRPITFSAGIAVFNNSPESAEKKFNSEIKSKEALIEMADVALYYSKNNGRNRLTLVSDLTSEQISELQAAREKEAKL